ncbi:hypothetical protein [Arthrobacter sp. MYb221]|uniref:hypothetical protein n=1 Tax=Arthrobacter sp. MYb221 TaxID=1848598 RepID=UPI0011B08425|nr:hypothetical protein [Arthrobacter sp. MYb221]
MFSGVGAQWPTSADIRKELADRDVPVMLSFSRGKDALAAWLAMLDSGIKRENIHPIYYELVPGLKFTAESVAYYEDIFKTKINTFPHPAMYRMWNAGVYQPIDRTWMIEASKMPEPSFEDIQQMYRIDHNLPDDTLICTGVRAADSIARRTFIKKTGPLTESKRRLAIVWDWTRGECYDRIAAEGIDLPPDYEWFLRPHPRTGKLVKNSGRTFDGLAAQFLVPLREHAPEDFATIMEWFPLVELDLIRNEQR